MGFVCFVDWDWVRLMGGVVFLGSLNGWVDGLVYEIDSCGLLLLLLPFVRRVMVVSLSKQTLA